MKPILISAALALVLSIGFTACQPSIGATPVPCVQTDISVPCLLKYTQTTLDETQDAFSWVSGASETVIAYDVSGQSDKAEILIQQAITKAKTIDDLKQRGTAIGEILTAIATLSKTDKATIWAQDIKTMSDQLEGLSKADVTGKIVVAQAIHNNSREAFSNAINLPQETDVEGYAKAITLRKIANILAKSGDLKAAREAIDSITMSIDYYKSMVRSDVARHAYKVGNETFALMLLDEADPIARSLGNGYFSGAALRDIGYSYQRIGQKDKAKSYFEEALTATAMAEKQNEKARSTSRIATRLSDAKLSSHTPDILLTAAAFADDIKTDTMKSYSYYEIAGAAAISGQFDLAKDWLVNIPHIPMSSTSSIKEAAKRDLAWGLARYGKTKEALEVVKTISSEREKIQALSRIIRVIQNPDMEALPRYL